jgi:hypothetical protein
MRDYIASLSSILPPISLIKAVNGGLVMVAFYPHFVSCGEKATLKDVVGESRLQFNYFIRGIHCFTLLSALVFGHSFSAFFGEEFFISRLTLSPQSQKVKICK